MPDQYLDLHFPLCGVNVATAYDRQPIRTTQDGVYAYTTPAAQNVRAVEPETNRARGASRLGLEKWVETRPRGVRWITQELTLIVGVGYSPPGGNAVQLSASGRVVTVVAVSQGYVEIVNPGDTDWSATINASGEDPPLNYTGLVYSTALNQKLWFADGTNYVYYDPSTNTVYPWLATAGLLPQDSDGNVPRLICTWRGRIVVAGLFNEPQNVFMSAVGDPTNWDYGPQNPSAFDAVALGNSPNLGLIGDVVTGLAPYNDDTLIIFGDHSITILRGDPLAGGQLDLVTDTIGAAWGIPWCRDPYGVIYFFSNRMGIYTIVPGQQPVRISQAIDALLQNINTGENGIRLIWDDRSQSLHVFITPLEEAGPATHYVYETRTGGWEPDVFGNNDHNPLAMCTVDGNEPDDRAVLLGGFDGYVRTLSRTAQDDDGTPIVSSVVLGPILTPDLDDVMLKTLQAVLSETSGEVTYEVYVGTTAEHALSTAPVVTGTWTAGRNLISPVRRSGHAVYIRLISTNHWAMESVRVEVNQSLGKIRRRGY